MGGRSPKRCSSPYADAWTYTRPSSAEHVSPTATIAGAARASTLDAVAPPTTVATVTTNAPGTSERSAVSASTPVTASVSAAAPQPAHAATVPVTCTARLRPARASPTARPPRTATTNHTTRAAHTNTAPDDVSVASVVGSRRSGTASALSPSPTAAKWSIGRHLVTLRLKGRSGHLGSRYREPG